MASFSCHNTSTTLAKQTAFFYLTSTSVDAHLKVLPLRLEPAKAAVSFDASDIRAVLSS
jgi:hypothetical protein